MKLNSEAIYGTRPWKKYSEGPSTEATTPLRAQGFNEGTGYGASDIRCTVKAGVLYGIALGWPVERRLLIKSLADNGAKVERLTMLGSGQRVQFTQSAMGLSAELPLSPPSKDAYVLKVEGVIT